MPNIDEEVQQRDTYAPAVKDAQAESSPADAQPDSSPEQESQEQPSQEATAPTSQPEPEKKFNLPPQERWEELRRQREDAERRAQQAEAMARMALEKIQSPQQVQPEVDPYAGMDAATAEFYRNMDKRIEQKAGQLAQVQIQGVLQSLDLGRRELAEIKINQFRQANPDIKPGSQEEAQIAGFVSQGYDLNSAKKLAMYDKLEAENRAFKSKQSSLPQKRAAAQSDSSSGIPQTAGLPGKPRSWKDEASEVLDKGGSIQDVFKRAFR